MDEDIDEPGGWREGSVPFRAMSVDEPVPVGTQLQPPTFLHRVVKEVENRFAQAGGQLHTSSRGRLAKFWFGPDGNIHYEIWLHERTLQIELGLHCESTPEYNQSLYKPFDNYLLEIQSSLGYSFWLEEWDNGWIRLYETHPFRPLDETRVDEIASRLSEIIQTLQPILESIQLELPPPPFVPPVKQRTWRR